MMYIYTGLLTTSFSTKGLFVLILPNGVVRSGGTAYVLSDFRSSHTGPRGFRFVDLEVKEFSKTADGADSFTLFHDTFSFAFITQGNYARVNLTVLEKSNNTQHSTTLDHCISHSIMEPGTALVWVGDFNYGSSVVNEKALIVLPDGIKNGHCCVGIWNGQSNSPYVFKHDGGLKVLFDNDVESSFSSQTNGLPWVLCGKLNKRTDSLDFHVKYTGPAGYNESAVAKLPLMASIPRDTDSFSTAQAQIHALEAGNKKLAAELKNEQTNIVELRKALDESKNKGDEMQRKISDLAAGDASHKGIDESLRQALNDALDDKRKLRSDCEKHQKKLSKLETASKATDEINHKLQKDKSKLELENKDLRDKVQSLQSEMDSIGKYFNRGNSATNGIKA